jgi:hypothetical protein
MIKNCDWCGMTFGKEASNSARYWSTRRFCSSSCAGFNRIRNIGSPFGRLTPEQRDKVSVASRAAIQKPGYASPRINRVTLFCVQCGTKCVVTQSRAKKFKYCSKACFFIGQNKGRTTADKLFRKSRPYREWRTSVFRRDGFACVQCGDKNEPGRGETVLLRADHIKPFALHPELRLDLDNGRTLCDPCHKQTDTFGVLTWRKQKTLTP